MREHRRPRTDEQAASANFMFARNDNGTLRRAGTIDGDTTIKSRLITQKRRIRARSDLRDARATTRIKTADCASFAIFEYARSSRAYFPRRSFGKQRRDLSSRDDSAVAVIDTERRAAAETPTCNEALIEGKKRGSRNRYKISVPKSM